MNTPPLLSFVGKSGSGKTTFVEKVIPRLVAAGLRVAVCKHHSHTTLIDPPGKDSGRYAAAGAAAVIVSSPVEVARFERVAREQTLPELIARLPEVDLVLTEGFKREAAPKVEISRAALGTDLVAPAADLVAVVADHPVALAVPRFALEDAAGFAAWLLREYLPALKDQRGD